MELYISPCGLCRSVYDELLDVRVLGEADIRRASHVEPTPSGKWTADLRPISGPVLGPFDSRSVALAAELAWLELYFENLHGELIP